MTKQLRPYQEEAVDRFRGTRSAFFAMEMRLGKTLSSIRWICGEVSRGLIAVVAPLPVLISWKDELEGEGLPYIDFSLFSGEDKERAWSKIADCKKLRFVLINYEAIRHKQSMLLTAAGWVLDESTTVKNPTSTTTKTFLSACKTFTGPIACLSGLPAPQCVSELWCQMAIIKRGKWLGFSNYYSFMNSMATEIANTKYFSKQNKAIIKSRFHKDAYVLTREQAGIQEEWIVAKRKQALAPKVKKLYEDILKNWAIPGLDGQDDHEEKYSIVVVGWLRRLCGGFLPDRKLPCWKYKDLKNLLKGELRNESVVIWCAYNEELKRIKEEVGIPYMCGDTTRPERVRLQKAFQSGRIKVLAVQVALGKFGIRLDKADVAIYFSNAYSCEKKQQSKDRIVDIEKTKRNSKALLRIEYITEDTIEEDVLDLLEDQNDASRELLHRTLQRRPRVVNN